MHSNFCVLFFICVYDAWGVTKQLPFCFACKKSALQRRKYTRSQFVSPYVSLFREWWFIPLFFFFSSSLPSFFWERAKITRHACTHHQLKKSCKFIRDIVYSCILLLLLLVSLFFLVHYLPFLSFVVMTKYC